MERLQNLGLSVLINILIFSFLPLLHYLFHSSPSDIKPIPLDVVKLTKERVKPKQKHKPPVVKKTYTRKLALKPELRRKITFELAPNALASEVDLIAPMVTYDLSEVDQLPRLIHYKEPDYPFEALAKKQEGVVILKILIDREGRVAMVKINDNAGIHEFGQESARALKRWRFEPAKIMGMPVAVWCLQKIHFELKN